MKNQTIFTSAQAIEAIETSHGVGAKTVLITGSECATALTQAALGRLQTGDEIEWHKHATMEEFYFFQEGEIEFWVDDQLYMCTAGSFIKVAANALHRLTVKQEARFIYWGIATN